MSLLYADLDVSLAPTRTCAVNAEDRLVGEATATSDPKVAADHRRAFRDSISCPC